MYQDRARVSSGVFFFPPRGVVFKVAYYPNDTPGEEEKKKRILPQFNSLGLRNISKNDMARKKKRPVFMEPL